MSPKKLPPLPKTVPHFLGPISIILVDDLKASDGDECFGLWDAMARVIRIRSGMVPVVSWLTLIHEKTHADLFDLPVKLTEEQEEAIANHMATARVTEMLYGSGKPW